MIFFWKSGERKGKGLPGRKQFVDFSFDYAGKRRHIPAVYRFIEGIIFDLFTVLDETELRAFYDKYKDLEETLTPAQRRAAEDEHPYQSVRLGKVKINGKQSPYGWSSTGGLHTPWMEGNHQLEKEAKAYAKLLNGASCFACDRYTIPLYAKPVSKWRRIRQWMFPEQITRMEFEISETTRFMPIDLSFTLPSDFSGVHTETFLHPQTKTPHSLHFQDIGREKVQVPAEQGEKTLYITQLSYEIDPALPEDSRLQFCSSIQWEQESIETGDSIPQSTGSIGIIGGADGPTAIFMAAQDSSVPDIPRGIHGLPLHYCFAKPSVRLEQTICVVLEGINIKWRNKETVSWELGIN